MNISMTRSFKMSLARHQDSLCGSLIKLAAFFLLALLSACSEPIFSSNPNTEVRNVLINVSTRHIGTIVMGDAHAAAAAVFADDYFGKDGSRVKISDFVKYLEALKAKYKPQPTSHPLLGLQITSVRQRGNSAEVRLHKDPKVLERSTDKTDTEIVIGCTWTGSAWIVSSDSLFGSGGLVPRLVAKGS
jgi:hypothetical protein